MTIIARPPETAIGAGIDYRTMEQAAIPNPRVALNVWPNPPWNTTAYDWDSEYAPASPEWFAQQTARNALRFNLQYKEVSQEQVSAKQAKTVHAPALAGPDVKAVNGVLTDTHLYTLKNGQVSAMELQTPVQHMGDIMRLALAKELQSIWVMADTELSARASKSFVDSARTHWDIKAVTFTDDVPGYEVRCKFLSGWLKKEARQPGDTGRLVYVGFAEHNEEWGFDAISQPVTLLLALTYTEDALGVPVLFSTGYTGQLLMDDTNKKQRSDWLRPVDITTIEPAMNNVLMNTGVSDIAWKRPLTPAEMEQGYIDAYDKNSMYPASCTSVLLGVGMPAHVNRPRFDTKTLLPGLWHVSFTGTSVFDGVNLPHPTDGITEGWFYSYTVKLLYELGYTVNISEAYVWSKANSHTVLRPFSERTWKARASLDDRLQPDTVRYPDALARSYCVDGLKLVQVKSLGWLDMTTKVKKAGRAYDNYRPHWYALLKDNARYQMFWRMRSLLATGIKPIGVHADCFFFAASTDDHMKAIPHMMERKNVSTKQYEPAHNKLGGFKRKYQHTAITMEQAAPLFNDPSLDIGLINKKFLASNKQAKKNNTEVSHNG